MRRPMPTEIERAGDHEVRITWDDGHVSVYRNPDLRFACPCATCVDEWSGVRRLQREQIPDDVKPTAIELVGNYALRISWTDGHSTGLYTFENLRRMG